ncbi:MAG: YabP/YqfC family sporulation protein [Lachnospiraceae bacterium]|nr:YabP/YqfC family sporulation protein [Lachnospiraceae bacterium]
METFFEALNLPKEICPGALNVKLCGQYEAYIENYRSIIEYDASVIKLQGKGCRVKISGQNLKIICFSKDDMRIKGLIFEVKFY